MSSAEFDGNFKHTFVRLILVSKKVFLCFVDNVRHCYDVVSFDVTGFHITKPHITYIWILLHRQIQARYGEIVFCCLSITRALLFRRVFTVTQVLIMVMVIENYSLNTEYSPILFRSKYNCKRIWFTCSFKKLCRINTVIDGVY